MSDIKKQQVLEKELYQPFEIVPKEPMRQPFEIVEKKDPEEIEYLVLYIGDFDGEEIKSFEKVIGRLKVYEFIKSIIDHIDIEESMILAETSMLKEAITIHMFMGYIKDTYYKNDNFDISDYVVE